MRGGKPEASSSRTPETLLRRVPRQERGHERVDKLLDAAAEVIAEVGVEATTTNAIAAKARTSVGSLYQFFPNKKAIVEALAARYNAELREINEATMPTDASQIPLPELMERIIMPAFEFYLKNPAYRHVYHALHGPDRSEPTCGEAELHKSVVARTEAMLASRAPNIPQDVRHLQATVAVLASHALLSFAMAASPTMRDGIVGELKRLLVSYVRDVTTNRPTPGPADWHGLGRF
jgi:AcrR family transcriptional regulator